MNLIIKVAVFSIVLNFAIGIMFVAFPTLFINNANTGGLEYDADYASPFVSNLENEVNPGPTAEEKADILDRILDTITMGIWNKLQNALHNFVYGFTSLLGIVVGGYMDEPIRELLFGVKGSSLGILNWLLNIGYIFFGIYLWTNRDLRT